MGEGGRGNSRWQGGDILVEGVIWESKERAEDIVKGMVPVGG